MRESSTTLPTQSLSTASQLTVATSSPFSRTLAKEHCVIIKYVWACIYARLACKALKKLIMGHDNTCTYAHVVIRVHVLTSSDTCGRITSPNSKKMKRRTQRLVQPLDFSLGGTHHRHQEGGSEGDHSEPRLVAN